MKKTILFAMVAVAVAMTSCAGYLDTRATTNSVGTKVGMVKDVQWLGIGSIDVSAAKAAKSAGITKIATCESMVWQGFLHRTYITKVTGE